MLQLFMGIQARNSWLHIFVYASQLKRLFKAAKPESKYVVSISTTLGQGRTSFLAIGSGVDDVSATNPVLTRLCKEDTYARLLSSSWTLPSNGSYQLQIPRIQIPTIE